MPRRQQIPPNTPLRECERRQTGFQLPTPISKRLDRLVEIVDEEGVTAYRHDIVGALILNSTEDSKELAELVLRYRKAQAGDAAVADAETADVLDLARARPGRRPRS